MKKSPALFFYDHYRIFLLVISAFVIFLHAPNVFLSPRFWMEEGSVYFKYAFNNSFIDALSQIHQGYFSLWPNMATAIANLAMPMEYAPNITLLFAFIAQILPVILILRLEGNGIFHSIDAKIMAVIIVLFMPLQKEIWLSTHTSQFYFLLSTVIVLLSWDLEKWSDKALKTATLFFAGFTGVLSCLITPIFWLKAYHNRNSQTIFYAFLMTFITLTQLSITLSATGIGRTFTPDPLLYLSTFLVRDILTPLIGWELALEFGKHLLNLMTHPLHQIFMVIIFTIFFRKFWRPIIKCKETQNKPLFLCFFIITAFSVIFAMGDKNLLLTDLFGHRYFYVPNVLLGFCLLNGLIIKKDFKSERPAPIYFLLVAFLFNGFINFYGLSSPSHFQTTEDKLLQTEAIAKQQEPTFNGTISWKEEVKSHRARTIKSSRPIRLHPKNWLFESEEEY